MCVGIDTIALYVFKTKDEKEKKKENKQTKTKTNQPTKTKYQQVNPQNLMIQQFAFFFS